MTSTRPGVPPDADPVPDWAAEKSQSDRKKPNRRRLVLSVIGLILLLALLGYLLWKQFYTPANYDLTPQPVAAVAEVASAPALAASAPEAPVEAAAPAAANLKTYTVKSGDNLGKRFGQHWKAVCDLNAELLKGNCHHLEAGWVLDLPEGVEPLEDQALPAKKVAPVVLKKQELSCIKLGASPFNPDHVPARAIEGIEFLKTLPADKKEIAKRKFLAGDKLTENELVGAQTFKEMLYQSKVSGKVIHIFDKAICDPNQGGVPEVMDTYDLGDGYILAIPRRCGNVSWFFRPEAPKLAPPPLPEPVSTPEPEPPVILIPPPPPAPVPVANVPEKGVCAWIDPNASLGQEHEPSHNDGDTTHSNFATVSLYCMRPFEAADGATGSHGFGGKVTASDWRGRVNHREGHFSGWNALAGPSYKRVMDEGYDWEVSLAGGHQRDRYNQGQYASQRDFNLVGMTAGYNDYRRRLAGEEWLPEKQFFGALTLPVSRNVSHSWNGQPIADTEELSRFRFGVQAGYRQWLHETSDSVVLPYFQAGIFVQDPTSSSLSLRLGVSDPARIVGVGAGIDQDLQNGGHPVFAWGWWADPIQGFRVGRAQYRKHQVITDAAKRGVTVEEKDGYIQSIRFSQGWLQSQGLQLVPTTPTTDTE